MLCEAKGLVSVGSHPRLGGETSRSFTIKSWWLSAPGVYYLDSLYGRGLYALYVKYDNFLRQNGQFQPVSPTATNGYA